MRSTIGDVTFGKSVDSSTRKTTQARDVPTPIHFSNPNKAPLSTPEMMLMPKPSLQLANSSDLSAPSKTMPKHSVSKKGVATRGVCH